MNDHVCASGDIIAMVFCMMPLFFLSIFLSVIFKELERKFENLDRKHR